MWERNAADDTFGFGVVFSDETLGGIEHADPAIHAAHGAGVRPLGRHRRALPRPGRHQRRPRLRGDEPPAAARDPAGALPRPRRRRCTSSPTRPTSTSSRAPTTSSSPPTGSTPRSARGTPTRSGRASTSARCSYMWLGTSKVFDAFTFDVRETPYGVMQMHGYPYDAHGQHVHRRDERRGLAGCRLRRLRRPRRSRPASPTRSRSRGCASSSPTSSTATR